MAASPNEMNVLIEGKRVILVDDVLYTGRSVRAAWMPYRITDAPFEWSSVSSLTADFLVNSPSSPDYSGRRVDAIAEERVRLDWAEDLPSVLIESTPHAAQR